MDIKLKKCEICLVDATCLCFECMTYYCDSCHKLHHNNEENKLHKKYKVDYYVPMDLKCKEHKLHPMDLFCINEKGKI